MRLELPWVALERGGPEASTERAQMAQQGFYALLHGGRLADAVLAFNPQTTLTEALLRPPAEKPADLQDLSQAVIDSVKAADGKAQITVPAAQNGMAKKGARDDGNAFPSPSNRALSVPWPPIAAICGTGHWPPRQLQQQWQNLPEGVKESTYKTVDTFLSHTGSEKSNTRVLFRKYATGTDTEGLPALSISQAHGLVDELIDKLKLPSSFFYDLDVQFGQFDFNGDGMLNAAETQRLVKGVLKERRAGSGHTPENAEELVPFKTLQKGGFVVLRELGRGGQGVMYLAKKEADGGLFDCRDEDDTEYCIKFYYKKDSNAGTVNELVDEFSRMKDFDNEYVARTYETFQDQDFYYLVNEPYFGGDWTKLACKAYDRSVHMNEDWWRQLFRQCLEGLDYLHKMAQMHCDIKEPNIMTRCDDDFRHPRIVYIDFGLSQHFARKAHNISGTPGYIPPETWQEQVWFPSGDIFSLGVVWFQMLAGRVPTGDKRGIFQEAADLQQIGRVTCDAPPPWHQFPAQWRQLGGLVASMLQKQKILRPRAEALLKDTWFASNSDASLPPANLARMVGQSKAAVCRSDLVNELCALCNLRELRSLRQRLDQLAREGGPAPPNMPVTSAKFRQVAAGYGVGEEILNNFMENVAQGPYVQHAELLNEVMQEKEKRSNQLVTNLFNEMDKDGNGRLSRSELRAMLQSDAFDCTYEDVDEVLDSMDSNHDGDVDFDEMKRAIMEDGRIAMKDEADRGERPRWGWLGLGF
ncbi:unnamed protein product [Effrenium voratum]|uniref:Calcium-dependent protein kinase n=1 Tax=Effrenium voratum TaxID=2562239 RepID=A0AA36J5U8_9DINO|nr:unnamed protein product [Effrenium voratum]